MNVENILKLADMIEGLPEGKFNMNSLLGEYQDIPHIDKYTSCGSPACIAGWAAWEQQGRPKYVIDNGSGWTSGKNTLINSALEYLGVSFDDSSRVLSELFAGDYGGGELDRITNKRAAKHLRHFAKTGEVLDWFPKG